MKMMKGRVDTKRTMMKKMCGGKVGVDWVERLRTVRKL
jgi:hypothetical protein